MYDFSKEVALLESEDYRQDHFEVNLADVDILKPDRVSISNKEYPLSEKGRGSLCKLLDIPDKFYKSLNDRDNHLWDEMVKGLKRLGEIDVRFSIGKQKQMDFINAFNRKDSPWIPNTNFLEMVQALLDKKKFLSLNKFLCTPYLVQAQFVVNDKGFLLENSPFPNDMFKMGIDVSNSELLFKQTNVRGAIHRMVCTNRATMIAKECSWNAKHIGSFENLIVGTYTGFDEVLSQNVTMEKWLQEKINRMVNVNASLREVSEAHKILGSFVERAPEAAHELDSRIPIKDYVDKYGLEFPIKGKNGRWLGTASTPKNLYELYNDATWVSSNAEFLTDEERLESGIALGKLFLGDEPDLLNIAPKISWN